ARAVERQVEAQERVEQTLLGPLELAPCRQAAVLRQVGDRAVEHAGRAQPAALARRRQPVAGTVLMVGAVGQQGLVRALGADAAEERLARRCQRHDLPAVGKEAERALAPQAQHVLEVDLVAAARTGEVSHARLFQSRSCRGLWHMPSVRTNPVVMPGRLPNAWAAASGLDDPDAATLVGASAS